MQQKSLAVSGFEKYRKQTRKEIFLEEMNQLIPWQALTAVIEPHYPNPRGAGRRPVGMERMPDATTRCKFRHLLEENNLGVALFDAVAVYLEENGMQSIQRHYC